MSSDWENAAERLHPDVRHHIVNSLGWPDLRDVQKMAIGPILDGDNTVLLAPTAGGKTEAAYFPLMTRLLEEKWEGMSLLYLSPIKALLNNQFDRLEKLFGLIGYTVGVWHGDISQSVKRRMLENPPNLLLTTPESLEGMLISTKTDPAKMFGSLQGVVIDEIHAFAGDDRGWHLLGILHRLSRHAGRDIQRVGLSATVGNPDEIAGWLSSGSERSSRTIDPEVGDSSEESLTVPKSDADVTLDWVGNLGNAATIISKMHRGERRLVFCDSRIQAEKLTKKLRERDVTTHLIHSSLSVGERKQTERSFVTGGPGVIVATSALELGIDIGDLDRVIQIDAPYSVASFLQRMGRTGRRAGATANCLFLSITDEGLLRAAALIDMWRRGQIEPAEAPGAPYHILAQQMMATILEQPGVVIAEFMELISPFCETIDATLEEAKDLLDFLLDHEYLFTDGARLGIGRSGEDEFGRRNFLELVSVFTTPPLFTIRRHRRDIGTVHQSTFLDTGDEDDDSPTVILLAGRSWLVTSIDWDRRIAYVEPFETTGRTRWLGTGHDMSRMLAQAHRRVLSEVDVGEEYRSQRAENALETLLMGYAFVEPETTTILGAGDDVEVWNFAGGQVNRRTAAVLEETVYGKVKSHGLYLKVDEQATAVDVEENYRAAATREEPPTVDPDHPLLRHLKFSELLPHQLLQEAAVARMYSLSDASEPTILSSAGT
jgi:ATP-dependent Lhr-like helicase